VTESEKQQLLIPAVYGFLIHYCLGDIGDGLYKALLRRWPISPDRFERLHIQRAPTRWQNLFAAFECQKQFGSEALKTVPGFYQAENVYHEPLWWIDIDPAHSRNGFILPELNPKYKFIDRLRVYRDPLDSEGFVLTTRDERQRRAA
jgi:hypothetical protein